MTEAPSDYRAKQPRYSKENLDANQSLVDVVSTVATKYNCTIAEISLAWLFNKAVKDYGVVVVPIPGTTRISNVSANSKSVTIDISKDDMILLDSLASKVSGERGNEWYMSMSIENQK
jgi:aryl-alcohol dehydrogenase-like predicted oxidoreductase